MSAIMLNKIDSKTSSTCQYKYSISNTALNDYQRKLYENNGYIVIKNLLTSDEIDSYNNRFLDIINGRVKRAKDLLQMKDISLLKAGKTDGVYLYYKIQNFLYDDVLFEYATNKRIVEVIQSIIGENITACFSMLFNKPPNAHEESSRHDMHQDLYNLPFRPADNICGTWTALERAYKKNGCLFVVPGTHKLKLYPHTQRSARSNRFFHGVLGFDHLEKVYLEMNKGDTVFFHPLLIHGSGPNLTNGFRRSISVHYANNDCYFIDVRGTLQHQIREQVNCIMCKSVHYGFDDMYKVISRIVNGPPGRFQIPLSIDNTLDEDEEILDDEDDSTTHTLERLSSAATCLVAGIEYTHGQQIYRKDPCEFCLCLDGEMFCWWQDCPPTLEGPCRERSAFSPCLNGARSSEVSEPPTPKIENKKTTTINPTITTTINTTEITTKLPETHETTTDDSSSITIISTVKVIPQTCIVMGREYKVGDKLPHDTGNCVECICGTAGQVTCSPNQCSPVGDDINDYRPPGPRTSLSDMF